MHKKVEGKLSVILGVANTDIGLLMVGQSYLITGPLYVAAVAVDRRIKSLFSTEESILWLYSIEMEIF